MLNYFSDSVSVVFEVNEPEGEFRKVDLIDLFEDDKACEALSISACYFDSRGWICSPTRNELFQPMSLSDYCRWFVTNVELFIVGGQFLVRTYELDVVCTAAEVMRVRCVQSRDDLIDHDQQGMRRMSGGERGVYYQLPAEFELPANVQVSDDISMPLFAWLSGSLAIAECYLQIVKKCHAIRLAHGLADADDEQCTRAMSTCLEYEPCLLQAKAALGARYPKEWHSK